MITKHCPLCLSELKMLAPPEGTMIDPTPVKVRGVVVRRCPNYGKRFSFG